MVLHKKLCEGSELEIVVGSLYLETRGGGPHGLSMEQKRHFTSSPLPNLTDNVNKAVVDVTQTEFCYYLKHIAKPEANEV